MQANNNKQNKQPRSFDDLNSRYDVKNIGYWVVYEQIGPSEWQCAYKARDKEDGERWKNLQLAQLRQT